jgi:hypothetical protein
VKARAFVQDSKAMEADNFMVDCWVMFYHSLLSDFQWRGVLPSSMVHK